MDSTEGLSAVEGESGHYLEVCTETVTF